MRRTMLAAFVLASACGAACSSSHSESSGDSTTPPTLGERARDAGAPTSVEAFACVPTTPNPGPTAMLLLSRAQYVNTLRDLFGAVVPNLDNALGADDSYQTSQFGLVQPDVDLTSLQNYQTAAEVVAAAVVADPKTLAAVDPCAARSE